MFRPWALLCFVCGFDEDRAAQRQFEMLWETLRQREHALHRLQSPHDVAQLAVSMIPDFCRRRNPPLELRAIICGQFRHSYSYESLTG